MAVDDNAPSLSHKASIGELVEDGMLLSLAGVRMAVKNLIIVRALRDGAEYDEAWYLAAVQHELLVLAAEKTTDADRVETATRAAASLRGKATHQSDYRRGDRKMLERRTAVLRALATELTKASEDIDGAGALVRLARQSALDDIAGAMQPSQQSDLEPSLTGQDDPADRLDRLALLRKDLRKLHKNAPK